MISFSDWNALLLYADELEEKVFKEHKVRIVIRPYNTAMYEKGMEITLYDRKGMAFKKPYCTGALSNLMDGKIIMADAVKRVLNENV